MNTSDAVALLLIGSIACIALYLIAMALGALAQWLVMKVKDHAAHR